MLLFVCSWLPSSFFFQPPPAWGMIPRFKSSQPGDGFFQPPPAWGMLRGNIVLAVEGNLSTPTRVGNVTRECVPGKNLVTILSTPTRVGNVTPRGLLKRAGEHLSTPTRVGNVTLETLCFGHHQELSTPTRVGNVTSLRRFGPWMPSIFQPPPAWGMLREPEYFRGPR